VETTWTLDAVPSAQKATVKSVMLIGCQKTRSKGTAFLLKSGTVVTAFHVVHGCEANELWARSPMGQAVVFSRMATDDQRDLAILRPTESLAGGLALGSDAEPPPEARVKTWGYPLSYQGLAPILSVGYVAGYVAQQSGNQTVKRLVINGAFNPGNSGGPLISARDNRVVGIVVAKWTLYSPLVEIAITGFSSPGGISGRFTETLPSGAQKSVTDEQVISKVLQEFYDKTQVMIGEAVSVSELKLFLREKEARLRAN
jgi:S1-C subfamily serine protease